MNLKFDKARRSQDSKNVTPDFVPKNPWREDEVEFS